MSGKFGSIDPTVNDSKATSTNMLEMWKDSIQRANQKRQSTTGIAQDNKTAKPDMEQKIRNGQAECPTCKGRQYADESSDGGVSFQAAKHIPTASAASAVMNHEREHVTGEAANAREQGGQVLSSTVSLEYGICPDCGRKYVAGGVTKTVVQTPAKSTNRTAAMPPRRGFEASV